MSFKKAIKHGKEHRKEYRGSKRFDSSCRNHGGCPYCTTGRLFASKRRGMSLKEEEAADPLVLADPFTPEYWEKKLSSPVFMDEMDELGWTNPELRAAVLALVTKP